MSYLIDAHAISVVRKGVRWDVHVSAWCATIGDKDTFDGCALDIGDAAADEWGRMSAIRPHLAIDGLLAATLTLVTRDDLDVAYLGATVFNPFRGSETND